MEVPPNGTFCSGNSDFMWDIKLHSQILCSVAGIEDTIGGRSQLRRIINKVLPLTQSMYVRAKRPVFQPSLSLKLIKNLAGQIENLELTDDLFMVSFDYVIQENSDGLIELLLELWFEYEQPIFCFFQALSNTKRKIDSRMTWKDVIVLEPCLVMFKAAEENVVWIGKNSNLNVDFQGFF